MESSDGGDLTAGFTRPADREESAFGQTTESIMKRMVEIIVEQFDPISITLFGSMARGDMDRHSDVDLLVIMPDGTDEQETQIEIRTALDRAPIAKDILVNTPDKFSRYARLPGTVQRAALRDGVRLYG